MVERDLLYAYQGLKDTTKGEESVEDHLPPSITQGASSLHSDEDMEYNIKLLDPRVQKLIRTYLEVWRGHFAPCQDVMFAVRAFWRELYDKRLVDLPGFQAVLGRHVPPPVHR